MQPNSTFIWQGRLHLGDEPGIYSDANYSGLSMEFPLTVRPFDGTHPATDTVKLELLTENVNVFPGYLGHLVVVRQYTPDPQPGNPFKWKETIIKNTDRILNGAGSTVVDIPIPASPDYIYISVAIEIDTDVKPGLYDDFLLTGLNYTSTQQNVFLNFGFRD